jgi:hypothetical protein
MKSVYEASTALDAHMILNLLEQQGIAGRVDGEYLPGGVGELQAINLVRVMVDESDYPRARQIISEWESIQVAESAQPAARRPAGGLSGFIAGLVVGGGLAIWAYHNPVTRDGIDVNGDGVPDEKRVYRDHRIRSREVDRNLDGRTDAVYRFDRRGLLEEARLDDDFDGFYETRIRHRYGQPALRESDLDRDGNTDLRATFVHGVLDEVVIFGAGGDRRKKRQTFHMGKRTSAEYDSDGDGRYDLKYEYDDFEEIR